jgi:hypothetical protein
MATAANQLAKVRSISNAVISGDVARVKGAISAHEKNAANSLAEGMNNPWTIDYFILTQQAQRLADKAALNGNAGAVRAYDDIIMLLQNKHRQLPVNYFKGVNPIAFAMRRGGRLRSRRRAPVSRRRSRRASRRS